MMKTVQTFDNLVKTSKALEVIGVSRRTLWRWIGEGILVEEIHFRRGLTSRSPLRWDVRAVEAAIRLNRMLPSRPVEGLKA